MSSAPLPAATARGAALARMAEVLIRALGGSEVALRFLTTADGNAGQLGLADAQVEDVLCSPVATIAPADWRYTSSNASATKPHATMEFLFPAAVIAPVIETRQSGSAQALFDAAAGVVHQGKLLQIVSADTEYFAGMPYLHRVRVSA